MNILQAPNYSDEECQKVIEHLISLNKEQISTFLEEYELSKSGTKKDYRERVINALEKKYMNYSDLVQFIDNITPWGKQHIFLLNSTEAAAREWIELGQLRKRLQYYQVAQYINSHLPLILPDNLQLASIIHNKTHVRIMAIERRDFNMRIPEKDDVKTLYESGETIEYKAYLNLVSRGIIALDWDLNSNTAMLQVSQMQQGSEYEEAKERFFRLTKNWLPRSYFTLIQLSPSIQTLHKQEENNSDTAEIRSQGIAYKTLAGRRLLGKSASRTDPLLGEQTIDRALSDMRTSGVGHIGNFYWLPDRGPIPSANPLSNEVHIHIHGTENRLNFPTANKEEVVRYVVSRVRKLSQEAS